MSSYENSLLLAVDAVRRAEIPSEPVHLRFSWAAFYFSRGGLDLDGGDDLRCFASDSFFSAAAELIAALSIGHSLDRVYEDLLLEYAYTDPSMRYDTGDVDLTSAFHTLGAALGDVFSSYDHRGELYFEAIHFICLSLQLSALLCEDDK